MIPEASEGMEPVGERYDLVRPLGEGASGEAWEARQRNTGQPVVIKLLHKKHARSPKHYERFRREVVALAKLQHPHVVQLLDCGRCERRGQPYFVMSFVDGQSVQRILNVEKRLGPRRAVRLIDQLLQALEFAHAQGILHRDLKPDNLLIERPGAADERLRVLDFGLAKHLKGGVRSQADLTQGGVVGTPLYLAPEQCRSARVSPATDIYALGCVLVRLLSGRAPFCGEVYEVMRAHVQSPAPRLRELAPDAPAALEGIVAACLEKQPGLRPSASALRRLLADAASALPVSSVGATVDLSVPQVGATLLDDQVLPLPPAEARRFPSGDGTALRIRMDVTGTSARVFIFSGTRLQLGRDRGENDLLIRAYPRRGEHAAATAERTRRISGKHCELTLTERGASVRDLGSSLGTLVNDARLEVGVASPLPSSFRLSLAGSIELTGTVVSDGRGGRWVRLRRGDEAPHVMYVLVRGTATIGSAETDAIPLTLPGILPAHAALELSESGVRVGPGRPDAVLEVEGRRPAAGQRLPLTAGAQVRLGSTSLRFGRASDEDMKP